MKMYRASFYGITVETVDVERVSESSVWIKGRRHARITDYDGYHATFEAARDWLVKLYQDKIDALQMNIDYYQNLRNRAKVLVSAPVQS